MSTDTHRWVRSAAVLGPTGLISALHLEGAQRVADLHLTGLGQMNLIVGESGVGKTLLLRAIAQSRLPTAPQVRIEAVPTGHLSGAALQRLWADASDPALVQAAAQLFDPQASLDGPGGSALTITMRGQQTQLLQAGDGVTRAVETALALSSADLLLVDGLDISVHHGVLPPFIALLFDAAQRHRVQVFASTHSLDCVHAFARSASQQRCSSRLIQLRRTASGETFGVVFDERDMLVAAEAGIDLR